MGIATFGIMTATLSAQEFRLGLGAAVAAGSPGNKKAFMAVRVEGCDQPGSAHVTATAEGLVNGVRRSLPVTLRPGEQPGAYAVLESWPNEGLWVLNFSASYRDLKAGALVPVEATGFRREPAKFYPRFATRDEVEATLKLMAAGASARK
jgi:hypothetical protein